MSLKLMPLFFKSMFRTFNRKALGKALGTFLKTLS